MPGSAENQLLWPTGRGNYLRNGRPWSATTRLKGDINGDDNVDLADVVLALKAAVGIHLADPDLSGEVDGDNKIGVPEATFALQKAALLR